MARNDNVSPWLLLQLACKSEHKHYICLYCSLEFVSSQLGCTEACPDSMTAPEAPRSLSHFANSRNAPVEPEK